MVVSAFKLVVGQSLQVVAIEILVWATALRGIYESYNFLLTNEESSSFQVLRGYLKTVSVQLMVNHW